MTLSPEQQRLQRIRMLRGSIKLLLGIGFLFLLVPFFKSIPWPKDEVPEDSVLITPAEIAAGETLKVSLRDGSAVFVTRSTEAQREAMARTPAAALWSVSAPGIADQDWWVVSAISAQDEALTLAADGSHLASPSGSAWDMAGRALKPGTLVGNPAGTPAKISAMKAQNLMPMPFKRHDEGILLLPLPAAAPATETPE
ncbi:MAG: hypothetical protein ACRERR_14800 [Moraxellaceae bacterium]